MLYLIKDNLNVKMKYLLLIVIIYYCKKEKNG